MVEIEQLTNITLVQVHLSKTFPLTLSIPVPRQVAQLTAPLPVQEGQPLLPPPSPPLVATAKGAVTMLL